MEYMTAYDGFVQVVERELAEFQQRYPYRRVQSLVTFFYGEVLSDLRKAHEKQSALSSLSGDITSHASDAGSFNIMADQAVVLSLSPGEDGEVMLLGHSGNAPQMFGYEAREFELLRSLRPLLLPSMQKHLHRLLMLIINNNVRERLNVNDIVV